MVTAADDEPGFRAVLVVCDGVSTSTDSDVRQPGRRPRRARRPGRARRKAWAPPRPGAALVAGSRRRADAANDAVLAATGRRAARNPPSLHLRRRRPGRRPARGRLVGDSRAYWLPDEGPACAHRRRLRGAAEQSPRASRGTRPRPARRRTPSPAGSARTRPTTRRARRARRSTGRAGCWCAPTDCGTTARAGRPRRAGRRQTAQPSGADPLPLAEALVDWANAQGGQRQHHRRAGPASADRAQPDTNERTGDRVHREEDRAMAHSPPTSTRTSSCPTAAPTCTPSSR